MPETPLGPPHCWQANDAAVSMHWWAQGAMPGDPCLCGERTMRQPTFDPTPEEGR